jgi:hypothetical protein
MNQYELSDFLLLHNFKSIWHLTKFKNLPSILKHGLLSRNILENNQILFHPVGWDKIVQTRPQDFTHDWVACQINPHNKFTIGRRKHYNLKRNLVNDKDIDDRRLVLIEIDLIKLSQDSTLDTYITRGNQAAYNEKFEKCALLDFHSVLDLRIINKNCSSKEIDNVNPSLSKIDNNHRMAEVLIKDRIPPDLIRKLWVSTNQHRLFINKQSSDFQVNVCPEFFNDLYDLPISSRPNILELKIKHRNKPEILVGDKVDVTGYGLGTVMKIMLPYYLGDFGSYGKIKFHKQLINFKL